MDSTVPQTDEASEPATALVDPSVAQQEYAPEEVETLDLTGSTDPSQLSQLLANATVLDATGNSLEAGNAPFLLLDQDQISRLENVLQSEEAKDVLGEVIAADPDSIVVGEAAAAVTASEEDVELNSSLSDLLHPGLDLGDSLTRSDDANSSADNDVAENQVDDGMKGKVTKKAAGERRSQRQLDKEIKEEADRIRSENLAIMRKEKEQLRKKSDTPEKAESKVEQRTASGRPKRERKIPAHLEGDFVTIEVQKKKPVQPKAAPTAQEDAAGEGEGEKTDSETKDAEETKKDSQEEDYDAALKGSDEDSDDEDDEDSGDGNSEDDPERLWCICQQPHNNRFMICCDQCLDWFHGKCVGITKKMGKDMEEVGSEWRCSKCKNEAENAAEQRQQSELHAKLMEREAIREKQQQMMPEAEEEAASMVTSNVATVAAPTVAKAGPNDVTKRKKKAPLPRRSDVRKSTGAAVEKKPPKEKTCFECTKPRSEDSIYCSDECLSKHVDRAKQAFASAKSKTGSDSATANSIIVMNPKTNQMFSGPSAPTEKSLGDWISKHPSFHVVIPEKMSTSKFYGSKKHTSSQQPRRTIKLISTPEKQSLLKDSAEVDMKLAEYKNQALSNLKEARLHLQSQLSESNRKAEQDARRASMEKRKSAEAFIRSAPVKQRKEPVQRTVTSASVKGEITQPPPAPIVNAKMMRENVVKGLSDAIKGRIEKSKKAAAAATGEEAKREHSVPLIHSEKLAELVRKIEDELYHLYNKEIGQKYKSQYRRLLFNIKDPKNNGLFRKIISGRLSPRKLVELSPEEMASKELQQWRQAVNKTDIEKIKLHELEMMKLGNKLVVKSHKGEQIIEAGEGLEEGAGAEAAVIKQAGGDELKLPEDDRVFDDKSKSSSSSLIDSKDRKKSDERRTSKDKHSHRSSSSRDKDRHHSKSSSSKDHHKSSSSSSSRHHSSSSSSSRHKLSSSKSSSSSSSHHHKSSSKSSHRDKDRDRHREKDRERHRSSGKEGEKSKSSSSLEKPEKTAEQIRKEEEAREEADKAKAFSEKVAKAEKAISDFNKSMAQKNTYEPTPSTSDDPMGLLDPPMTPPMPKSPLLTPPEEVSSTVQIKTPEDTFKSKESDPIVWKGVIDMKDVAVFNVHAYAVSGLTDYLTVDLASSLTVCGRIPPKTIYKYINEVVETNTKEVLVTCLIPAHDGEDRGNYLGFYEYLTQKKRCGVTEGYGRAVKDCYIIPLAKEDEVDKCLLPFDGPGLSEDREDMLLCLIVRTRRSRPGDSKVPKEADKRLRGKESNKRGFTPPSLTDDDIMDVVSKTETVSKKAKLEEDVYDPAMAGTIDIDLSEDGGENEDYDPESAFPVDKPKNAAPPATAENPQFSPPDSPKGPITSSGGGFTEQLAKLTEAIKKEKESILTLAKDETEVTIPGLGGAESAAAGPAPGFKALPSTISDILFGKAKSGEAQSSGKRDPRKRDAGPSSSSSAEAKPKSTLSKMSDADLLAKALEMESSPPSRPPPPFQTAATSQPQAARPPANMGLPTVIFPPAYPGSVPSSQGPPPSQPNWNQPPPVGFTPNMMAMSQPPLQAPPPQGPWMQGFEPQQNPAPWATADAPRGGGGGKWDRNDRRGDHGRYDGPRERKDWRGNRGSYGGGGGGRRDRDYEGRGRRGRHSRDEDQRRYGNRDDNNGAGTPTND